MRALVLILSSENSVVARPAAPLPESLWRDSRLHFLVVDDAGAAPAPPIEASNATHLATPFPYGPGGVQKLAFRHALDRGFDWVVVVEAGLADGDLARLIDDLPSLRADAVLVSAPGGGALAALHNRVSGLRLRGWRASLRAYRCAAAAQTAFELNTSQTHFNTEFLLQLVDRGSVVLDRDGGAPRLPAGPAFWRESLKAAVKYRLQKVNLFYDARFHPELLPSAAPSRGKVSLYDSKFEDFSPHALIKRDESLVPPASRVLDIGCSSGYVSEALARDRGCAVVGVDLLPESEMANRAFTYRRVDLEKEPLKIVRLIREHDVNVVLMLDVLEHLSRPEVLLLTLYRQNYASVPRFFFSTGNVAFFGVRVMLLFGFFNYGEKGILDITHKRLFSHRSFRNLLEQTGFRIERRHYFPIPYRKLGFSPTFSRIMEKIHRLLIRVSPSLFAYQMMFETRPISSPVQLLALSEETGAARS